MPAAVTKLTDHRQTRSNMKIKKKVVETRAVGQMSQQWQTELAGVSLTLSLLPEQREIPSQYATLKCNYEPKDRSAHLPEGNSDFFSSMGVASGYLGDGKVGW